MTPRSAVAIEAWPLKERAGCSVWKLGAAAAQGQGEAGGERASQGGEEPQRGGRAGRSRWGLDSSSDGAEAIG